MTSKEIDAILIRLTNSTRNNALPQLGLRASTALLKKPASAFSC